jgi:hypothetical protein
MAPQPPIQPVSRLIAITTLATLVPPRPLIGSIGALLTAGFDRYTDQPRAPQSLRPPPPTIRGDGARERTAALGARHWADCR